MGFLNKIKNLLKGKGYKSDEDILYEIQKAQQKEERERKLNESIFQSDDIDYEREESINNKEEENVIKDEGEVQDIIKSASEPIQTREIKEAVKEYKKRGNLRTIEQSMDTKRGEVSFRPTTDLGNLRGIYNNVLRDSVVSTKTKDGMNDSQLINVLIENRNRLQHRFSAEIIIDTDKGIGNVEIDGVLAEHTNDIFAFIQIGQTYTSEELKIAVMNMLMHFEKQYGSIGGNHKLPESSKVTIRDIQVRMVFA